MQRNNRFADSCCPAVRADAVLSAELKRLAALIHDVPCQRATGLRFNIAGSTASSAVPEISGPVRPRGTFTVHIGPDYNRARYRFMTGCVLRVLDLRSRISIG